MMSKKNLPYDPTSSESILAYARRLLGKSLQELYPDITETYKGKGELGQIVEKFHFHYLPNSVSEPDFPLANVELKCTPLKSIRDGSIASKERLVLNIINYTEEFEKTFETSSFMHKNALLLLMFYLHLESHRQLNFPFKIIRLWSIPNEDLKIFRDDWNTIHRKIAEGRAHELSEGDTLYLAACIKGSKGGKNKRRQPVGDVLADQRAYSIKSSYMNYIILESLRHQEMYDGVSMSKMRQEAILSQHDKAASIVRNVREYKNGETFEQLVIRKFLPFLGIKVSAIMLKLRVEVSEVPKDYCYNLCRAILGVKGKRIAEFEKAGLQLKTIRLESNGRLREAMSFQKLDYFGLIHEDKWELSDWYDTIGTKRFLFVVFRKQNDMGENDLVLERLFFWSMPVSDIALAESFWRDTRDKVRNGDYDHFMKSSEHPICHVRPKAKNAADLTPTPQGKLVKKYCYWLNRKYILEILRQHLGTSLSSFSSPTKNNK